MSPRFPRRGSRPLTRLTAAAGCVALAAVTAIAGAGPAPAVHLPLPPTDPAVAGQWVNPDIRPTDRQAEITVDTVSVSPPRPVVGDTLVVTVAVTNNSSVPVDDLSLRLQHAAPAGTASDALAMLAGSQDAYGWMAPFHDVDGRLDPGETVTVSLRAATGTTTPPGIDDLLLTQPGTYPLMVNLNGAPDNGSIRYLDSDRMLLAVHPGPGQPPAADGMVHRPVDVTELK